MRYNRKYAGRPRPDAQAKAKEQGGAAAVAAGDNKPKRQKKVVSYRLDEPERRRREESPTCRLIARAMRDAGAPPCPQPQPHFHRQGLGFRRV